MARPNIYQVTDCEFNRKYHPDIIGNKYTHVMPAFARMKKVGVVDGDPIYTPADMEAEYARGYDNGWVDGHLIGFRKARNQAIAALERA